MDLKGQGAVTNFERTLAAADLLSLDVVDPSVAYNAFARLREQLNRALEQDRRQGLLGGGESEMTSRGGTGGGGWRELSPGVRVKRMD